MLALLALLALPAQAMPMTGLFGDYAMSREASGTSWQPEAAPHDGRHFMAGEWMGMVHGFANAVYDDQGGRRGGIEVFSASMFMAHASRRLGPGRFGLHAMVSGEPAMGPKGYPLLLQTGETADGRTALVDRQHPHNLIDELAATYSLPAGGGSLFLYAGLPGEAALGPPMFWHRFSGAENPEAPITHHWLDSTHITNGVATLGWILGDAKLEASSFNGREPDQHRYAIGGARLDSYSFRASWNPDTRWALQASYGYLDSPEQLEPAVDVQRYTASAIHHRATAYGPWQSTLACGQNQPAGGSPSVGCLLESAFRFSASDTVFGRAERVEKDELFASGPLAGRAFTVAKLSVGYVRDLAAPAGYPIGVGGLVSILDLPAAVKDAYGSFPVSFMVWLRVRIA